MDSNIASARCDYERLECYLNGSLDETAAHSVEEHLSACPVCRDRLERTASSRADWQRTQELLRSDELDAQSAELGFWQFDASEVSQEHVRDARRSGLCSIHSDSASLRDTRLYEQMLDLLGPTDDPAMLGRIGAYEITGILGHGGMGVVFKGYDGALSRYVAIKMLLPHLAAHGAARKRFAREAQAAAAVVDDHVMAIHGVSEWRSVPYFLMPYARGVSLQNRLTNDGPLRVREVLRIGMQAAKGLAAAHSQGLVHRDVKPANIFLDEGVERVQLMDFGLARAADDASLTCSGVLAGTPQYMSPEQARAETVDHRSDLFSLGSVLYAMCTGHAPFRAESSYAVLRLITDKEPRPIREIAPDIPSWLCAIIGKLMSKEVNDRFDSAEQVAEKLTECLAHVQNPTTSPLPDAIQRRFSAPLNIQSKLISGAIVVTTLLALAALLVMQITEPPETSGSSAPAVTVRDDGNKGAVDSSTGKEPLAVAMLMHPGELVGGNALQRAAASKSLRLLAPNDYCGILQYGKRGTFWLRGDGSALSELGTQRGGWIAAIAASHSGDFPVFDPAFAMALNSLENIKARPKLLIVFTDGDPVFSDESIIDKFRKAKIGVSVIHVDIHQLKEVPSLKRLTEATGGNYHYVLAPQAAVVERLFEREIKALRTDSAEAFKKIAIAFHEIHEKTGSFPGSRMTQLDRFNKEFQHPFSWRVAILPYIGHQSIFDEYRFDEPWDSENNQSLLKQMPDIYRSPYAPSEQPSGHTNLFGFATERGALGEDEGASMSTFTDGLSKTILVVETAHSSPWTKPGDLVENTVIPFAGHPLRFVLADGAVSELNPVEASKLGKMITRNGADN